MKNSKNRNGSTPTKERDGLKLSKKDLKITKVFGEVVDDDNPQLNELLEKYGY